MTQPVPSHPIGLSRADHVGITVSDLDAPIRFYEALTGTTIANKDKVLIRYASVHLDNLNIDLLQYDEPASERARYCNGDIGAMHLRFEVNDLEAVHRRMVEVGFTFSGTPMTFRAEGMPTNGIGTKAAYFDDPDGTHLEIIEPQGPFRRKAG